MRCQFSFTIDPFLKFIIISHFVYIHKIKNEYERDRWKEIETRDKKEEYDNTMKEEVKDKLKDNDKLKVRMKDNEKKILVLQIV